jgi:hypothetical protein
MKVTYELSPYVAPENAEKLLWKYGFANKYQVKKAYLVALKKIYYKEICKILEGQVKNV